jgi:hypothetical protein
MTTLIPTRRRRVPGRGITALTEVHPVRSFKTLHLCRFPAKCCSVCGRHKDGCWHDRVKLRVW